MNQNERIPYPHPGETLLHDFMEPLELTSYRVAKDIGVEPIRISRITRGMQNITPDTAMRLSRYFGTTPEWWMRLQAAYDLAMIEDKQDQYSGIKPCDRLSKAA
jgi:addiction module HigA family antidote